MVGVDATMAAITEGYPIVGIVSKMGKKRPSFEVVRLNLRRRSACAAGVVIPKQHRVPPMLIRRSPDRLWRFSGVPASCLGVLACVRTIPSSPRNLGGLSFERDAALCAYHLDGTGPERLPRPSGMVATLGAVETPASLGSIWVRREDSLAVRTGALDFSRPIFREASSRAEASPPGFSITRECGERLPAAVTGDHNHRWAGHDLFPLSLAIVSHVRQIRKVG
jgi:hypothetical protein